MQPRALVCSPQSSPQSCISRTIWACLPVRLSSGPTRHANRFTISHNRTRPSKRRSRGWNKRAPNASVKPRLSALRVATLTAAASNCHPDNDQTRTDTTSSATHTVSSEETEAQAQAQEKLLTDTRAELAGLKKVHASDQASIVADQIRINELSDQLKTTKANTSNTQRQLVTVGGDVPNMMGARQLHVVDVRDSGPTGSPARLSDESS